MLSRLSWGQWEIEGGISEKALSSSQISVACVCSNAVEGISESCFPVKLSERCMMFEVAISREGIDVNRDTIKGLVDSNSKCNRLIVRFIGI